MDDAGEALRRRVAGHDGRRELQKRRRRRAEEYHGRVLSEPDPLKATLGSINAEMMQMCIALDEAIHQRLFAGPPTLERIMRHAAAMELQLKLSRQVERFAQLELRAENSRPGDRETFPADPQPAARCTESPS